MSFNGINWDSTYISTRTIHLTEREYAIFSIYKNCHNAIRRYYRAVVEFLSKVKCQVKGWLLTHRYGSRINVFGQEVPNIEYYLGDNGNVYVRKYSKSDGVFRLINGLSVRISDNSTGSMWSEGNVSRMGDIAREMIDAETDAKAYKKTIEVQNNAVKESGKLSFSMNGLKQ
jgi:hypothetical protein